MCAFSCLTRHDLEIDLKSNTIASHKGRDIVFLTLISMYMFISQHSLRPRRLSHKEHN